MSTDNSPNGSGGGGPPPHRRSSITQAALSNLFQRAPSNGGNGSSFPASGSLNDPRGRRLSVTTIGLSGTSPTNTSSFVRRGSMSTNSDSIDESAIEEEDMPGGTARTAPNTPFVRRMSFGQSAMRGYRPAGSPGNGNNPTSPPSSLGRSPSGHRPSQGQASAVAAALSAAGRRASTAMPPAAAPQASSTKHPRVSSDNVPSRADQQGFNWSEQLRSRAESSVTGARPSFSLASSPPRGFQNHDRAKSVSDMPMPQPPAQAAAVKPKQEPRKPDAFQERILKGDFYMD
ncbi:Mg2+ transporter protein, CorA-like protein [Purpureocillium lavendulum]|uniref:Mg2+ transporter protein, CorA-like protein n=1 Tax=Purpureocillium lavendulum TaxID=1247861 RepID=A0AB34G3L2_9HYPO|nr:Mg2+ transporter protein, CorA-like protein [Purpureocillium lavendulum]